MEKTEKLIYYIVYLPYTMASGRQMAKFKVKSDLSLFKAIQRNGRLSELALAQQTNISATTVHYAMQRLKQRDFFNIRAVPRLDMFQEIPLAIIGFANVHPMKLQELKERYIDIAEIVQFFHSEKDVVLFVMDVRKAELTKKLFDIIECIQEKPCIYITSPKIARCYLSIPDHILDGVYADLPERRLKSSVKLQ